MSGKWFFHVVFYKTQRLYVHFGKILRTQRLYVLFSKNLRAQRLYVHIELYEIGRSVIIHDVNSRQDGVKPVGMLRPEGLMALTNENISRGCSTSSVLRRD